MAETMTTSRMQAEAFDIERYLSDGVEDIIGNALKASLANPRETAFLLRYGAAAKKAARVRSRNHADGIPAPPFLIASITGDCNLSCKGCYARSLNDAKGMDCGAAGNTDLESVEWSRIFSEARDLGVSLMLLAGGEPMLRQDVIREASRYSEIIFPVFTNGTLIDQAYLALFDQHRNLIPILSIEGDEEQTDTRRSAGIYARVMAAMGELSRRGILFGASITVTKENLATVTGESFIDDLAQKGCRAIVYVEYIPVERRELALDEGERRILETRINAYRAPEYSRAVSNRKTGSRQKDLILISFPGDEKASQGCLAAGRGFFHINAAGGAEPCPFAPYSDTNFRTKSLREVLDSPLFQKTAQFRRAHRGTRGGDAVCLGWGI